MRPGHIPESELKITFARSSGPGGQNVNKTATKAVVRWHVGASRAFTRIQKAYIRVRLKNRLNSNDELVVSASEERSQKQNQARAMARLIELVQKALLVKKPRRPTKPTRASKLQRLEYKKKRSRLKQTRQGACDRQ